MIAYTHRTASRRRRATGRRRVGELQALLSTVLAVFLALLATPTRAQKAATNRQLGSEAIVPQRQHSLYSPYVESDLQNKFWDFGGDAIVDTNRAVRLTQDKPSQAGWLWTRGPLNVPNYEIEVEFKIDGKAHGNHPYGDGLAIWLTEERAKAGPIFGNQDYFSGTGIIIDTFANARHPYTFPRISIISLNGVEHYHTERDGAGQEMGGCSFDVRQAKVATKVRLTHVRGVFTSLDVHYNEWDTWENCFKLGNLTLPEYPYLGMTAATGEVTDNHDIVTVTTNSIVYKERTRKELDEARKYHLGDAGKAGKKKGWFSGGSSKNDKAKSAPASGSSTATTDAGGHHYNGNAGQSVLTRAFKGFFGLVWTLLKVGAIFGVIGAGGYIYYTRKKKLDAKRF